MVKSEALFNSILSIDTLIAFDGVIPSLGDFQLKLISLIEQFSHALIAENHAQEESEMLCHILCDYFDKRISTSQSGSTAAWERYSLIRYFYGYDEGDTPVMDQLETLLTSENDAIFLFARKLLTLMAQVIGQSEKLVALRTACQGRHIARAQYYAAQPESETPVVVSETPRLMVFIIGPFARKWFNQSDLALSNDNAIVWSSAPTAAALAGRLEHLKQNRNPIETIAFFPVLADGFENNAVLIEQIAEWRYAFSTTPIPRRLPCLLGLYSRLSAERSAHDPDKAIWTGRLNTRSMSSVNLEAWLTALEAELEAHDDGKNVYAMQRHALGRTLFSWMAESRVMRTLQNLFDTTQLDLTGITLADHGPGMTRHGAWSTWLSERYGILPGLSSAISMPPLPFIHLPPLSEKAAAALSGSAREDILPEEPVIHMQVRRRRRWPAIAAALILGVCALGAFFFYGDSDFSRLPEQIAQTAPYNLLKAKPGDIKTFTFTGIMPLFENGSSTLMPDSEEELNNIAPQIAALPNQIFLIIGHSDNTGSAAVNLALSAERARVIRDWLVAHPGLPASHFIIEGAGNTLPVASNDTKEGRAQNRRVEIIPLSAQRNNH